MRERGDQAQRAWWGFASSQAPNWCPLLTKLRIDGQSHQLGARREDCAMTVARDLAEFLTRTSSSDLPPQAVERAAMLIASTLASAAMGAGLRSSAIIRALASEQGGPLKRPCGLTEAQNCRHPLP